LSAPLRRGQANLQIIAFHPKEGHEDCEGHRCEDRTLSRRVLLASTEVRAVDPSYTTKALFCTLKGQEWDRDDITQGAWNIACLFVGDAHTAVTDPADITGRMNKEMFSFIVDYLHVIRMQ